MNFAAPIALFSGQPLASGYGGGGGEHNHYGVLGALNAAYRPVQETANQQNRDGDHHHSHQEDGTTSHHS
ncbi:hypothetical protein HID58_072349 [Brassica napus]|uniref:Uncharacterized protein n=2 Tax=Brassica TaxID=3705 RepID=A0ABQ7Z4F4_BRANA|nr:hypothetical protein HID58_072349 [Brassica napus]